MYIEKNLAPAATLSTNSNPSVQHGAGWLQPMNCANRIISLPLCTNSSGNSFLIKKICQVHVHLFMLAPQCSLGNNHCISTKWIVVSRSMLPVHRQASHNKLLQIFYAGPVVSKLELVQQIRGIWADLTVELSCLWCIVQKGQLFSGKPTLVSVASKTTSVASLNSPQNSCPEVFSREVLLNDSASDITVAPSLLQGRWMNWLQCLDGKWLDEQTNPLSRNRNHQCGVILGEENYEKSDVLFLPGK